MTPVRHTLEFFQRRGLLGAWWALVALVVADRIRLMAHFSWQYTDKDQTLLWTAAYEMMNGRFHEPRWYGQDYNTLLESLLAVPLVAAEIPYHVALPVVTSALCLAPFILLSACALRTGCSVSAFIVLATPLLLPTRYGFLTSMPRGFVTGLIFAAIPACLLMFRLSPARLFASGFLLVLSVSVNPSALILALPVGLCLLFENSDSSDLYRWGGAGLVLAVGLHVLSIEFYRLNPAYVVYGPALPPILAFDIGLFRENALHAARYLGDVAPALPGGVAIGVLVFGLTLLGLAQRGAGECVVALLAGAVLTLGSLGLERLHGGSESIWWSWSRNYLCVPLLAGVGLIWLERAASSELDRRMRSRAVWVVGAVAVGFFAFRVATLDAEIDRNLRVKNPAGVKAWSVEKVERGCAALAELAAQHDAELVVFRGKHKVFAYACEPLHDGRVKTLLVRRRVAERRTWRLREEAQRPARAAILYNFLPEEIERGRSRGLVVGTPGELGGIQLYPVQLPPGREAFELFSAMGVSAASDLIRRLDQLGVQ